MWVIFTRECLKIHCYNLNIWNIKVTIILYFPFCKLQRLLSLLKCLSFHSEQYDILECKHDVFPCQWEESKPCKEKQEKKKIKHVSFNKCWYFCYYQHTVGRYTGIWKVTAHGGVPRASINSLLLIKGMFFIWRIRGVMQESVKKTLIYSNLKQGF